MGNEGELAVGTNMEQFLIRFSIISLKECSRSQRAV
jgi:hypothetical protein